MSETRRPSFNHCFGPLVGLEHYICSILLSAKGERLAQFTGALRKIHTTFMENQLLSDIVSLDRARTPSGAFPIPMGARDYLGLAIMISRTQGHEGECNVRHATKSLGGR